MYHPLCHLLDVWPLLADFLFCKMLIVSLVFLAKLLEIHKDQALYESLVISLEYCNLFMREPAFITMSLLIWSENRQILLLNTLMLFLLK